MEQQEAWLEIRVSTFVVYVKPAHQPLKKEQQNPWRRLAGLAGSCDPPPKKVALAKGKGDFHWLFNKCTTGVLGGAPLGRGYYPRHTREMKTTYVSPATPTLRT